MRLFEHTSHLYLVRFSRIFTHSIFLMHRNKLFARHEMLAKANLVKRDFLPIWFQFLHELSKFFFAFEWRGSKWVRLGIFALHFEIVLDLRNRFTVFILILINFYQIEQNFLAWLHLQFRLMVEYQRALQLWVRTLRWYTIKIHCSLDISICQADSWIIYAFYFN